MLGETYVEELRLAETPPAFLAGRGEALDPRTMGVATVACTAELSPGVAGSVDVRRGDKHPWVVKPPLIDRVGYFVVFLY